MNTKPTAIDAYLARAVAIHFKLAQLQQLAEDHCGPHVAARSRPTQIAERQTATCQRPAVRSLPDPVVLKTVIPWDIFSANSAQVVG